MISNSIVLVVINMSDNVKCKLVKPWEDYIGYHDCIDIKGGWGHRLPG